MNKILVSPPAFIEKIKIHNVIQRFLASNVYQKVDYLIVDDCSTDGTTEVIASFQPQGVKTARHTQHKGVGAAIKTAIQYALDHGYEILVIMAGNDKDNPNEIASLVAPLVEEGYDFVQGSRYLKGEGPMGDMPYYRKVATKLHPWLMSLFTQRKITDSTNGFRAIRLSILKDARINWRQDWLDAYELEPYLLFKTIKLGYRYTEAVVTKIYPPKKLGYTKMKPLTGWWSILRPVFYLGLGIKK